MIKYSEKAEAAIPLFFSALNDVDIYVEDVKNKNVYLHYLRNLFGSDIKINRIFQAGGKIAVIKKADAYARQINKKRLKIFIVDGDFDFVLARPAPPNKYIYRLDCYCFENRLLSEKAMVEIALESSPNLSSSGARNKLALQRRLRALTRTLFPLFARYAVCYSYYPMTTGFVTVGYSVARLCSKKNGKQSLDCSLVRKRISEVYTFLRQHLTKVEITQSLNSIDLMFKTSDERLRCISAKDYIFPVVKDILNREFKLNENLESLKVRLARHCDTDADVALLTMIKTHLGGLGGAAA